LFVIYKLIKNKNIRKYLFKNNIYRVLKISNVTGGISRKQYILEKCFMYKSCRVWRGTNNGKINFLKNSTF